MCRCISKCKKWKASSLCSPPWWCHVYIVWTKLISNNGNTNNHRASGSDWLGEQYYQREEIEQWDYITSAEKRWIVRRQSLELESGDEDECWKRIRGYFSLLIHAIDFSPLGSWKADMELHWFSLFVQFGSTHWTILCHVCLCLKQRWHHFHYTLHRFGEYQTL